MGLDRSGRWTPSSSLLALRCGSSTRAAAWPSAVTSSTPVPGGGGARRSSCLTPPHPTPGLLYIGSLF